jgi:hypothetical protein
MICVLWLNAGGGEVVEIDPEDLVFRVEFFFDGGEGAEEVGGVSHDSGAAGVDAAGSLKLEVD